MTIDVGRRLFTRADYHKMAEMGLFAPGERVELLEGEIRAMSPIGPKHASVVRQLNKLFMLAFREKYIIAIQDPFILDDESEPEPDVMILRYRSDLYESQHPTAADVLLLVEVSDTTLRYDRMEKLPLYAAAGIPEVWIVDVNARRIEHYHTPQMGTYTESLILTTEDSITTTLGITFEVADVLGA